MRRFLFTLFLCLSVSVSFAEVRDLFAEFEAEATKSSALVESSSSIVSSASVVSSSSVMKIASSSSVAKISSSSVVNVSSSSVKHSSSSKENISSSSVTPSSSSIVLSSSEAESSSSQAMSSSLVVSSSSLQASSSSSTPLPMAVMSSSSSSSATSVVATPSSSSLSRRDILGPVKVSKVRGIDEMKGRYKDPRKALFMSLVIPGSGQIYVGGSNFNYIRGGAYLVIEAGLWSGWYYYAIHKYDKQVSKYKKFANAHYSASAYENAMHTLYGQLGDTEAETNFNTRYTGDRESYCKAIYGTATTAGCYSKDGLFLNDAMHLSNAKEIGSSRSLYDQGSYYSFISGSTYVLGWDDVEDETPVSALNLNDADAETVSLGSSSNLKSYRDMRTKANNYADMQAWFFGGLILNHLVSALDAAWTAHAHNKVLYEEDLSWYDQLHFYGGYSPLNAVSSISLHWIF